MADKSKKELIIEARRTNLCATLAEIGNKYGVTREYARQVLSYAELPTRGWHQQYLCNQCNKSAGANPNRRFCSTKCREDYYSVTLICDQCGNLFQRKSHAARWALRYGNKENKLWFCNRRCQKGYYQSHSEHFGFGAYWKRM